MERRDLHFGLLESIKGERREMGHRKHTFSFQPCRRSAHYITTYEVSKYPF